MAWSGELGYGVRSPEPGQQPSATPDRRQPDPMLVERGADGRRARDEHGHDDGHGTAEGHH